MNILDVSDISEDELAKMIADAEEEILASIDRLELGSTPLHAPVPIEALREIVQGLESAKNGELIEVDLEDSSWIDDIETD